MGLSAVVTSKVVKLNKENYQREKNFKAKGQRDSISSRDSRIQKVLSFWFLLLIGSGGHPLVTH